MARNPQPTPKGKQSKVSAGLLVFRRAGTSVEVLLVHPGGPFFSKRDDGVWSIPKGEASAGEDLLSRAKIEFEEELGVPVTGEFLPLGWVRQKGGKTVHAWAVESDLPSGFQLASNTFEIEWPPRSGRLQAFPEIDRAQFFTDEIARLKINSAQVELLDRLIGLLSQ
jgi:predicted NUDIX family NTP pyrophosphohydrolase